jgi:hypothetical protein
MPGWVLPAVAAELWGVSVEQVMADVAAGRLNARVEGEFVFVDVQPSATGASDELPARQPVTPSAPYRRSLAWSVPSDASIESAAAPIVTAAERDALIDRDDTDVLSDEELAAIESAAAAASDAGDLDETACDAPDEPIVLTTDDIPNWGEVRARVGRTRRPPRRILDAA